MVPASEPSHDLTRGSPEPNSHVQIGEEGYSLSEIWLIDQVDLQLRADLEEAERWLRAAAPSEKQQARRHFERMLHRFSVWVFDRKMEPLRG